MGADYSKIHRLLRLLTLMQSGEAGNASALAERLGTAECLRAMGIGVADVAVILGKSAGQISRLRRRAQNVLATARLPQE